MTLSPQIIAYRFMFRRSGIRHNPVCRSMESIVTGRCSFGLSRCPLPVIQPDRELCPLPNFTLRCNVSVMYADDLPCHRKTDSHAVIGSIARLIESLEDVREMLFFDSCAVILYHD